MRSAALFAVVVLALVCVTLADSRSSSSSGAEGAIPKPVKIVGSRGGAGAASPRHSQAGDNVAKIVPFATLVNKLPKGAKRPARKTRTAMPVVQRLPPGFARYVNAHIAADKQDWVATVKEGSVGQPKIAFRYDLQRHQLPVLPEPSSKVAAGNDVNDPLFYHQHIFERDPTAGPAVRKGAKLIKPWVMPACCGKPVVTIKPARHINTMTPLANYITSKERAAKLPVEAAYKADAPKPLKVKPLKWSKQQRK